MKVAVYEPCFRICGPVTWAQHVRDGFREASHSCDTVTVTKSGKSSTRWGHQETYRHGLHWSVYQPDVVLKHGRLGSDSHRALNDYDLVILTEPKNGTLDRSDPIYLEVLSDLRTPWTTALHGAASQYTEKIAPHLETIWQRGNFCGRGITPSPFYVNERMKGVDWLVYPCLPFASKIPLGSSLPMWSRTVGWAGRVVTVKGPQFLIELAARGLLQADVEVWGPSFVGSGPAPFTLLGRRLETEGWQVYWTVKEGTAQRLALRPDPWRAEKDGRRIQYHGNYGSPDGVFCRFPVQTNLTSADFSFALIEYVGLEALERGCLGVYPDHLLGAAPYHVAVLPGFVSSPGVRSDGTVNLDSLSHEVVDGAVRVLHETLELSEETRRSEAEHNREVIREYHDPAKFAEAVLRHVFA